MGDIQKLYKRIDYLEIANDCILFKLNELFIKFVEVRNKLELTQSALKIQNIENKVIRESVNKASYIGKSTLIELLNTVKIEIGDKYARKNNKLEKKLSKVEKKYKKIKKNNRK